jgi:hypothetical protein
VSWLLRSLVAGIIASEADRILDSGYDLVTKSIPSNLDVVNMRGTPSPANLIDRVSLVTDPEALGNLSTWGAINGKFAVDQSNLPGAMQGSGRVIADGTEDGAVTMAFTTQVGGQAFFYAYARVDADVNFPELVLSYGSTTVGSVFLSPLLAGQWQLLRIPITTPAATTITAFLGSSGAPPAGTVLRMTGLTYVEGADPLGPFTGDDATTASYAYGWQGGRHGSSSLRYGQQLDLPSLMEIAHSLDVAPVGWSVAQRAAYLVLRLAARHHPYKSTFASLIAQLVATEQPTFNVSQVQINENFANRSFTVTISHDPSGILYQRLLRLIADIQPLHLRFGGLLTGEFRAGPGFDPHDMVGAAV